MSYFSHSWLPYLYQYGLGAVSFIFGVWLTLRSGSFDLARKGHRRWLGVLILGFVWYATLHAALNLAALGHEAAALCGGAAVMAVSAVGVWQLLRRLAQKRRA